MVEFASWRLLAAFVGISLLAGCVQEQAPQAAAPQAAPVAAAPHTSSYAVYFDTNRATINANAEATIENIATAARNGSAARVTIVGKADTVGKANANMKLSQERAAEVRGALVRAGLPSSSIATSWTGETQLPVSTANNVAEARNRVVEVVVQTMPPATAAAPAQPPEGWGSPNTPSSAGCYNAPTASCGN